MSQNNESQADWDIIMEWLREQPEYSEELPTSEAPQTEAGKLNSACFTLFYFISAHYTLG